MASQLIQVPMALLRHGYGCDQRNWRSDFTQEELNSTSMAVSLLGRNSPTREFKDSISLEGSLIMDQLHGCWHTFTEGRKGLKRVVHY